MSATSSATPWQPLTLGGVAAFATGGWFHFLLLQLVMVLVAAGVGFAFFVTACFPVLDSAVAQLPEEAGFRDRKLVWSGEPAVVLGETGLISLGVNAVEARSPGTTADLEVLFAPEGVQLTSWFGHWFIPYWSGWKVELTQKSARAWWAAWRRVVALVFGLVMGVLSVLWVSLSALLLGLPVWVLGRGLSRQLSFSGAWRLVVASFCPPGLILLVAVLLYETGRMGFLSLLVAGVFHFLALGFYLFLAPWYVPRVVQAGGKVNPFEGEERGGELERGKRNPFSKR
ncbi:MAG: hypothetical protein RI897_2383 [Verrucomicrobiota bacterium]